MIVHTILYVADQKKSSALYSELLSLDPILDVPGMTEFQLSQGHVLGLMPEQGIKKLLGDTILDPALGRGIPRAELYLRVKNPEDYLSRAKSLGLKELSPFLPRNWGDSAGYFMDFDCHILAFAGLKE